MKRSDIVIGETYIASTSNDWISNPFSTDRVVIVSDRPFVHRSRRWYGAPPVDPVRVRDLTDQAPAAFVDAEVVRGTSSTDGWQGTGAPGLYPETVGVLTVKVDEDGHPTGPAGVRRLRDIRATYEEGTKQMRANQRARAEESLARAKSAADADARFESARTTLGTGEYVANMYRGRVSMSLAEYERIAALIANPA